MQDVNLDSFCEELLQQSSDVGPARVSFDVSDPLLPFLQRICNIVSVYCITVYTVMLVLYTSDLRCTYCV